MLAHQLPSPGRGELAPKVFLAIHFHLEIEVFFDADGDFGVALAHLTAIVEVRAAADDSSVVYDHQLAVEQSS